jgi:Skp family chaperone for outer membrane proteins
MQECCTSTKSHEAQGCCGPGLFFRHFRTAKEEQERLDAYKDQLQKELAGVEERIQKCKDK